MGLILYIFWYNNFCIDSKTGGFSFLWRHMQISPLWIAICWYFYRGDILLRRRFVPETFCYRRRSVTETFCYGDVLYGDVLSRRRVVWDVLYVRQIFSEGNSRFGFTLRKFYESWKLNEKVSKGKFLKLHVFNNTFGFHATLNKIRFPFS
jgi:hypothetical protein